MTPRSRSSFTESRGEIISWPQLSYTNIWHIHTYIHFLLSKLTSINSFSDLLLSYTVLCISSRFTVEDFCSNWHGTAATAMLCYWHLVAIMSCTFTHILILILYLIVPSYSCPYSSNAMLQTGNKCVHKQSIQESLAIAKTTARCAQYMGALKSFKSRRKHPRLLFPKFVKGFCSDRH